MSEKDKIDVNEEEEEEVITLATPDGEEVDFTEIAAVEFEDKLYVIMQPVELFEGMEDDEALVFAVTDENEEDARFGRPHNRRSICRILQTFRRTGSRRNARTSRTKTLKLKR